MKRKGFFSRLADKLFGGIKAPARKARKQKKRQAPPKVTPPPVVIQSDAEVETGHVNYTLAGWRMLGGEWQDVEAGAPLPVRGEWKRIDLITVNLDPNDEQGGEDAEGFYRSASVFHGFDEHPNKPKYDFYDEDPPYTLDNLAYELALEYGFAVQ